MNINDFLKWEQASRDTIDVKRIYVDIAGDLVAGILLSQIVYWHLPNQQGQPKLRVKKKGDLWLAKGRDDWWAECRVSPKQFDRAIKILEDKELVEKRLFRFNGSPTVHLKLLSDNLLKQLESELKDQHEPDFTQRGKWNLTKGENGTSPKGKNITESTTKSTTLIKKKIIVQNPKDKIVDNSQKEESLAVKDKDNEKEKVNKGNTVSDNLSTQDKLPKADTSNNQQKKVDKVDYQSIVDLYHENCPSLPKVLKINETRKKLIRARLRDYDLDEITTIFANAEASDFLSGRDGAWQSCNFNWLLTDSNALKVLEGTYNPDKSKKTHSNQPNLNFYIPEEEENDHNTEAAAIYAEFRGSHC